MQARSPLAAALLAAPFLATAMLAGAPSIARADIAPPRRAACHDKKVGEACSSGAEKGTCTARICTDRAGEPWDCLLCVGAGAEERPARVEQPPAFATPLFDAGALAPHPAASDAPSDATPRTTTPPAVPAPVGGGGCGRCAASTGASDADRLRALALVAAIVVARRASRTKKP